MRFVAGLFVASLLAGHGFAQSSPSFRLTEHAFNAGGNPLDGSSLASASLRVSLDAIGDAVSGASLASPSFRLDGGFVSAYPPPGEVRDLRFGPDHVTLTWTPDPSVGTYALYRDLLSNLAGLGFGGCAETAIPSSSTTDTDLPAPGNGYFYLVTARNRLLEEGTKGFQSTGVERANPAPCP